MSKPIKISTKPTKTEEKPVTIVEPAPMEPTPVEITDVGTALAQVGGHLTEAVTILQSEAVDAPKALALVETAVAQYQETYETWMGTQRPVVDAEAERRGIVAGVIATSLPLVGPNLTVGKVDVESGTITYTQHGSPWRIKIEPV